MQNIGGFCKAHGEITYCCLFNTEKEVERELNKALVKERENIENLLEINYCENKVKELDIRKNSIKDIQDKKAEGHRIRARMPKFEETESNITYDAKLEKSKSEKFNLFFV